MEIHVAVLFLVFAATYAVPVQDGEDYSLLGALNNGPVFSTFGKPFKPKTCD